MKAIVVVTGTRLESITQVLVVADDALEATVADLKEFSGGVFRLRVFPVVTVEELKDEWAEDTDDPEPAPFSVGDRVHVLAAIRLPLEVIKHTGTIREVVEPTDQHKERLYVIDGLKMRYSDLVLRSAKEAR